MLNLLHGTDIIVISSGKMNENSRLTKFIEALSPTRRVYVIGDQSVGMTKKPNFFHRKNSSGVEMIYPYLPTGSLNEKVKMIEELISDENIPHLTLWTDCEEGLEIGRLIPHDALVFDKLHQKLKTSLINEADVILSSLDTDESVLEEIELLNHDGGQHIYLNGPVKSKKIAATTAYAFAQYAQA